MTPVNVSLATVQRDEGQEQSVMKRMREISLAQKRVCQHGREGFSMKGDLSRDIDVQMSRYVLSRRNRIYKRKMNVRV